MSRWLAGIHDPSGRVGVEIVAGALAPKTSTTFSSAPLCLAYSGPPAPVGGEVVCLLDGWLDNATEIEQALGGGGMGAGSPSGHEELLATGFRRWGVGLPRRMRGDFALLVWDKGRGEGLLARDQLGVRSVFLHDDGGTVRFASEIRDLLVMLPGRPAPDPVSVAHWLGRSNRPGMQTLYQGIRRLSPGGVLLLDRRGAREERYWEARFEEPLDLPPDQLALRMREELERAVDRRMDDRGATGVLMSGGLDSSSVAALCAKRRPGRTYACSATFPEHPATDESELIEELRQTLGLPGITAAVRPGGLLAGALEHLAAWKVPLSSWGDPWALALMGAAKAAGVGTMLGGDGGDELFAPRSYLLADRLRGGHPLSAFALVRELPGAGPWVPRREMAEVASSLALIGSLPYRLHKMASAPFAGRNAPGWFRRRTTRDLVDSDDPIAWKRLDGPRWWADAAHGLVSGIEEAGVMEHHRRRAAVVGLDVRQPMLDLDLVELGLRQPPLATFDRRFNRPVLRAAMAGLLPDSVRLRPQKAWFESLVADSLAGPDGEAVRHLLMDPGAELGAYLDLAAMRAALFDTDRQRQSDPFRWMSQVWRLLTAECWLRDQANREAELLVPGIPMSSPDIEI